MRAPPASMLAVRQAYAVKGASVLRKGLMQSSHLQRWRGKAHGKDLGQRPQQLVAPVQLVVGGGALQRCRQRVLSRLVLQPRPREQHVQQPLSQHKGAPRVPLLHKPPRMSGLAPRLTP